MVVTRSAADTDGTYSMVESKGEGGSNMWGDSLTSEQSPCHTTAEKSTLGDQGWAGKRSR